jgi:hypothetical protein
MDLHRWKDFDYLVIGKGQQLSEEKRSWRLAIAMAKGHHVSVRKLTVAVPWTASKSDGKGGRLGKTSLQREVLYCVKG